MHYIEKGITQNAKLVAGGKRIGNTGYFVEPTVFSDVTDEMLIAKDEVILFITLLIGFRCVIALPSK